MDGTEATLARYGEPKGEGSVGFGSRYPTSALRRPILENMFPEKPSRARPTNAFASDGPFAVPTAMDGSAQLTSAGAGSRLGFSTGSLRFRLGATLVLALLPLGVLSIVQTSATLDQVRRTALEGIQGGVMDVVEPQVNLIRSVQTTASVLAAGMALRLPSDEDCRVVMRAVAAAIPDAFVVGFVKPSGRMDCSSVDGSLDLSGNEFLAPLLSGNEPKLAYLPSGPVSGKPVVATSEPVIDPRTKAIVGRILINMPHGLIQPMIYADENATWRPLQIAAFTGSGTLLASSVVDGEAGETAPRLPLDSASLAAFAQRAQTAFFVEGRDDKIISVTSVAKDFYMVSAWIRDGAIWGGSAPYLLPILTWAAALIAAAWASGQLVVRHIRALAQAMLAYGSDRTRSPPDLLADSPDEIRALHGVYLTLIRTIEEDEADLQNLLIEKDMLLREVNHRSGNNLQTIASAMRLYRSHTEDANLRRVLDGLITRVIALASTNIALFSQAGRDDVPMDLVLVDVIRRLKEIHTIPIGTAHKSLDSIRLPAEVAIPLALALAEAVNSFFGSESWTGEGIAVALFRQDDEIRLRISGPAIPQLSSEVLTGVDVLPRRMLEHFAAQMQARLTIAAEAGQSIVELAIPQKPPQPSRKAGQEQS